MEGSSRERYSRSRRIRKSTSACGRRQFSREKAYRVRHGSFRRAQLSMIWRAVFTPARCPATRGRWRFWAQRPLPSMITDTCCGNLFRTSLSRRSASSRLTSFRSSVAFTRIHSRQRRRKTSTGTDGTQGWQRTEVTLRRSYGVRANGGRFRPGRGFFYFAVDTRFESEAFADYVCGGKRQNGRGEQRRVEQAKGKQVRSPLPC